MAYRLLLSSKAESHLSEIIEWYSEENADLSNRFLLALETKFSIIETNPHFFQKFHKDYRSVNTDKFPYRIVYKIHKSQIVVIAIAHHKRHPKVWIRKAKK